jgi:hypothetical protein
LPRTPATRTQAISKALSTASLASMPALVPSQTTRQPSLRRASATASAGIT